MKAASLSAAGLLALGLLASLPMAQAADIPSPCGPTALCEGPSCPPTEVSTRDFFAYLGPHASVAVDGACNVTVTERGLQCSFGAGEIERSVGPATVEADACLPSVDCICDPLPVDLQATPGTLLGEGIDAAPKELVY